MMRPVSLSGPELKMFLILWSLLQNPFFRESKRNRMEHEYESEREPRSILQVPQCFLKTMNWRSSMFRGEGEPTIPHVGRQELLEREILAIADREKQHIGRELHDGLC